MNKHFYNLPLHVLIYPEEGRIVAHALEMDLLGYGNTQEEACQSLEQAVEAQLTFAVTSNSADIVSFRAPEEFFERWEKAHAGALRSVVTGDLATTMQTQAVFMEITAAMQEEARRGSGAFVEEPELAYAAQARRGLAKNLPARQAIRAIREPRQGVAPDDLPSRR